MPPFVLIILLAGFPALATDMYLPALPILQKFVVVVTGGSKLLTVIFLFFFSLDINFGPLADRFGSRPVLFAGLLIFIAGSLFLCDGPSIGNWCLHVFCKMGCGAAASSLCLTLSKRSVYRRTAEKSHGLHWC